VIRRGLSFKKSGLDLDRKIWQSAHLCCQGVCVQQSHAGLPFSDVK